LPNLEFIIRKIIINSRDRIIIMELIATKITPIIVSPIKLIPAPQIIPINPSKTIKKVINSA